MPYEICIINNGYFFLTDEDNLEAKCTCTLIKGNKNVIVNTMTPWDDGRMIEGLVKYEVDPKDIAYIVSTNGSSSYIGNNHMFRDSVHIIGNSIQSRNVFLPEPFSEGKPFYIDEEDLKVIPTPGRTLDDISVVVKTEKGIVVITGTNMYEVFIIKKGLCEEVDDNYSITCTCTLIKGKFNVIVNTLSVWDYRTVLKGVYHNGLGVNDINYVVSTHARPDYCGNNHLFKNGTHIVGHSISRKNKYEKSPLSIGNSYYIDEEDLKIIPTPGYTLTDITVVVRTSKGKVYITGELFQDLETIDKRENSEKNVFTFNRRIEYPICWRFNRNMVMNDANYIIPGHGDMFEVTEQTKKNFFKIYKNLNMKRRRDTD